MKTTEAVQMADSSASFYFKVLKCRDKIFTIGYMRETYAPSRPFTVRTCPLNRDATIRAIGLDERHRFRMLELGLREGSVIRVIQRSNFSGRVVAKGAERIALDGQTAASITVTLNDSTNEQ